MADKAASRPYISYRTYAKFFFLHVLYQMVLGPILGLMLMIFKNKEYAYNLGFIYAPSSKLNFGFWLTFP